MTNELFLVVGLGNPGPRYAGNRHNAGFMVVDALAHRAGARFKAHRSQAQISECGLGEGLGWRAVLVKPMSFMNISGGPVVGVRDFFKVPTERIVVVHDELDLPYGALRLKQGGGTAGHNGLRSLAQSLGSPDFLRVRFGIGRPPGRQPVADFVLTDFAAPERKELAVHIERAADAVEALLARPLADVQNIFHADYPDSSRQ